MTLRRVYRIMFRDSGPRAALLHGSGSTGRGAPDARRSPFDTASATRMACPRSSIRVDGKEIMRSNGRRLERNRKFVDLYGAFPVK